MDEKTKNILTKYKFIKIIDNKLTLSPFFSETIQKSKEDKEFQSTLKVVPEKAIDIILNMNDSNRAEAASYCANNDVAFMLMVYNLKRQGVGLSDISFVDLAAINRFLTWFYYTYIHGE